MSRICSSSANSTARISHRRAFFSIGSRPRLTPQSRGLLLCPLPALAFSLFVVLVPTVQGALLAFTKWKGLAKAYSFVGIDNLVKALSQPASLRAVINTIVVA